jgi:hypothetical protein
LNREDGTPVSKPALRLDLSPKAGLKTGAPADRFREKGGASTPRTAGAQEFPAYFSRRAIVGSKIDMSGWNRSKWLWIVTSAILGGSIFLVLNLMNSSRKIMLGAVENVALLPWEILLPARIDSGAATSALDARDIKLLPGDEVEFKLAPGYGGQLVRRHLKGWRTVKSSNGITERRPVVMMELVLGPRRFSTPMTLTDRSNMEYPLLIGRKTLGRQFTVDVTRSHLTEPEVTEEPDQ